MNELQMSDDKLRAVLRQEARTVSLQITDPVHGRPWGPVPLGCVSVHDKMERRCIRVSEFDVLLQQEGADGIRVTLGSPAHEFRLVLRLSVIAGELAVRFDPAEMQELMPEVLRVFRIDLLPGLMCCGRGGRLLLPLQSGMVCSPAGKPRLSDRFMIYGEQSRWELMPMLPICAAQSPTGGLMALATAGAADTECRVETDGEGGGQVGFAFSLRQFWPDPVDPAPRAIRYAPIASGQDLVIATAKRLRRHVMADLGKPTLSQRAAESPEVAALLPAYIIKLFHGMNRRGMMAGERAGGGEVPFVATLTFAEAKAGLQRMHAAGIGHVLTQSVGWNPGGHDGMWPSRFPIEERLGGEAGFHDLIAWGNGLGYQMNVHDNYTNQYKSSPLFDPEVCLYDQWGNADLRGFWGGGANHAIWPPALGDQRLSQEMQRVKGLGLRGMYYIDAIGNPLECNHHPGHRGSRGDYAAGVERILTEGRRVFGAVGTECGFLYAAVQADCMVQCGNAFTLSHCDPEWPITALIEKIVPVWQLALHSLIVRENHGMDWPDTMRCVLFGDHPRDEWSARPDFMPALDDARIAALKARYDVCLHRFGHLQTLELTTWEQAADGIERTTFEDGTEVVADFDTQTLLVNRQRVERPPALPAGGEGPLPR